MDWHAIARDVEATLGQPVGSLTPEAVGGGGISAAWHLRTAYGEFFLKTALAEHLAMFEAEAEGLGAIAAANAIRVPHSLGVGVTGDQAWHLLEYIHFGRAQEHSEHRLGEQVAALHRHSAERFGWHRDNTIGSTPQPNAWSQSWLTFFSEQRLRFQLELAASKHPPTRLPAAGERLLLVLPALLEGHEPQPSLVHGDFWGGNWNVDDHGEPVLFDPAPYYGDRETDLAMSELFGGFGVEFYSAYREAWPVDDGYELRRDLYKLYHVLNHFNLFGGGYGAQALSLCQRLAASVS